MRNACEDSRGIMLEQGFARESSLVSFVRPKLEVGQSRRRHLAVRIGSFGSYKGTHHVSFHGHLAIPFFLYVSSHCLQAPVMHICMKRGIWENFGYRIWQMQCRTKLLWPRCSATRKAASILRHHGMEVKLRRQLVSLSAVQCSCGFVEVLSESRCEKCVGNGI